MLEDLMRKSRTFSNSLKGERDGEQQLKGLRDLWRDVMLKAGTKIQDLQNALRSLLAIGFDIDEGENFAIGLSNCSADVNELVKSVEEFTPLGKDDDVTVELVKYQVFCTVNSYPTLSNCVSRYSVVCKNRCTGT